MTYKFPCLYCGDMTRKRTAEHVLQGAFGTSLTLDEDVCDHCNRRVFSPVDTELVTHVRTEARATHPDVEHNRHMLHLGHSISLDPNTGAWFSVRRSREGQIVPMRQIVIVGEGRAVAIPDGEVLSRLRSDLAEPSQLRVQTIVAGESVKAHTSIIWSAPKCYLVRASDGLSAQEANRSLLSGELFSGDWSIDVTPDTFADRNVEVRLEFDVRYDRIHRALAKTAINFLCNVAGPELARRPEFAPIREFALRDNPPDVDPFVILDPYRQAPEEVRQAAESFCRPGHHTMMLSEVTGVPVVALDLYGAPFALIRLVDAPLRENVLGRRTWACLFDYRQRTHRLFSNVDGTLHSEFSKQAHGV